MLIELVKRVVYLCLCFSLTTSHIYPKTSERTPKKHVFPNMVASNIPDSYYKQSRYIEFDKVKTRLDKMNSDEYGLHKFRHKGWSNRKFITTTPPTTTTAEMDLFETYGELESEDDFVDYEDTLDDEEDDYDDEDDTYSEDEQIFESVDDDVQAEEPTEKPTSTSAPRPVSKLTEYKWNHFGTREKVQESMREQLNVNPSKEELRVKAVIDHYARVNQQSKCLTPLPRVISVQQEHSDLSKSYIPPCTVLHRCAEDSGCCKRNTRCQYKTRVLVSLYFYAKVNGQDHNTIEKLDFYNHTECECKYIPSENGKDIKISSLYLDTNLTKKLPRCNCPKPYQEIISREKCTCDCDDKELDCIQLKKGKEHFSMINRICIQDSNCTIPTCEYGAYMVGEGKCPTKQDRLEEFRHIRIHN